MKEARAVPGTRHRCNGKSSKAAPTDQSRQQFKVKCYTGRQLREDGERPPRSAKLVVSVDMGSGPGGGDHRSYLLSTNRERSLWVLWLRGDDWEVPLYCRIATGRPYRGYPARFAAEQLLIKSWQDEHDKEKRLPPYVSVWTTGLLTDEDIRRIKRTVFGQ
jgi:hypothetical protein